jgi:spore germination protein PE
MQKRLSIVGHIKIQSNVLSSIVRIGDTVEIKPRSRTFAVHREVSSFLGDEGDLSQFPIFKQKIPEAPPPEEVDMKVEHLNNIIHVHSVYILGLSNSAVFHVGSNQRIDTKSRIKHIRQFVRDPD